MDHIESNLIIKTFVDLSEKAAHIARLCRTEKELFQLLVEEKTGNSKNNRFGRDFKTLADVLIQEMVRHGLSFKFPGLEPRIFGEESNTFTNTLQQTVVLEVTNDKDETFNRLFQVLNGDTVVADILTNAVYSENETNPLLGKPGLGISVDSLGVWIDPIDATSEYIANKKSDNSVSGLPCVCVLLGAYHLETGLPVLGVINQPFYTDQSGRWSWGMYWEGGCRNQIPQKVTPTQPNQPYPDLQPELKIAMSSTDKSLAEKLKDKMYDIVFAAGAGYKCYMVILEMVDFYVLGRPTTYKWDTCAPHAILLSLGGGIVSYQDAIESTDLIKDLPDLQLKYNEPIADKKGIDMWCNSKGIIAYRNKEKLKELVDVLKDYYK